MADCGFSMEELREAQAKFEAAGAVCEMVDLTAAAPPGINAGQCS